MNKLNFTHINLSNNNNNVEFPSFKKNSKGWINYDVRNDFPQRIINLNNESSLNKSILENKVTYIIGDGIDDDNENYYGLPNISESWNSLIEKITKDYTIFGGFAFQVILNENKSNVSLYHTDFSKVRCGEFNEFGKVLNYYISNDWTKISGKLAPVPIQAWGTTTPESGKAYLFYYFDYQSGLQFYPVPAYYAGIRYIESDIALSYFYKNSINNNFTGSYIITMPSNPTDEEKAVFQKEFEENFTGVKNSGNFVVLWGENETVKPVITPISASNNVNLYNSTNDIIFQKICTAHRLTSPSLAGISGRNANSYNNTEIVTSYILYNYTVIQNIRNKILETINQFVVKNGYQKLQIKELPVIEKIVESASFTQSIDVSKEEKKKEEK
jgi:hypothetical protein